LVEPQPDVGIGTSLWLVPADGVRDRLAALIRALAARFGTDAFVPHVTLLAGLRGREGEVVRRAGEMCRALEPVRLRASRVEGRDEFFRCLTLRVEETLALLTLNAQARISFARADPQAYEPHLSVLYGRLGPESRAEVEVELRRELPIAFEASVLEVWRTRGRTVEWSRLAAFPLGPGPS
jgi:2'-5' RNA ligase